MGTGVTPALDLQQKKQVMSGTAARVKIEYGDAIGVNQKRRNLKKRHACSSFRDALYELMNEDSRGPQKGNGRPLSTNLQRWYLRTRKWR